MSVRNLMPALTKAVLVLSIVSFCVVSLRAIPSRNRQSQEQPAADAQSQSQSIADAARRSREQAKNATKASKVITDDDLDKTKVKPGQQGLTVDAPAKLETQPPTPDAVAEAATSPAPSADPATAAAPTDDPEILKMKDAIAEAEKDADLLKREFALEQDTFLSNADHEHDLAGKAKLDALQQQINDKQQDVDRLKTRLAALQELHHAPPPPPAKPATSPVTPPATPPANAPAAPVKP
jgi:hypothetical protein